MIRPQLHEVLGHVVHARIALDGLKVSIITEMQHGYRPTYRGHSWTQEHFEAVNATSVAVQCAFDWLKWLQFPEVESRRAEALAGSSALEVWRHPVQPPSFEQLQRNH